MKPYFDDGTVTIYLGDCLEVLPTLEPVDLVLTDPPYGIGVTGMTLGSRKAKPLFRGSSHWDESTPDIDAVIAMGTNAIVWGGNFFALPPSRGWLVWDKQNGATSFADCELAWTNLDSAARLHRRYWSGAHAKERFDVDRFHPTQKPVGLMHWCIGLADTFNYAHTILDPFAGSGTTGRAAKDLGRKAILIEKEERWCEVAAKRMSQAVLL